MVGLARAIRRTSSGQGRPRVRGWRGRFDVHPAARAGRGYGGRVLVALARAIRRTSSGQGRPRVQGWRGAAGGAIQRPQAESLPAGTGDGGWWGWRGRFDVRPAARGGRGYRAGAGDSTYIQRPGRPRVRGTGVRSCSRCARWRTATTPGGESVPWWANEEPGAERNPQVRAASGAQRSGVALEPGLLRGESWRP